MSLRPEEMDFHRKLLAAMDEYIRLNLTWEEKGGRIHGKKTRKALRKILDIGYLRWQEIMVRLHEMDVEKGNKPAKRWILKDPGLAFIQSLNAAKKRSLNSDSSGENDDST